MPLIDDMGLPLRESPPLLIDKLVEHGLRERGKVQLRRFHARLVQPNGLTLSLTDLYPEVEPRSGMDNARLGHASDR